MSLIRPDSGMNSGYEEIYSEGSSEKGEFYTGHFSSNDFFMDPIVTGYAFIVFTRFPKWVTDEYKNAKNLLQKNFQGFEGLSDLTMATGAHTEGFSAVEYHAAQAMGAKPSTFTLKHNEYSGSPIKNMYQHWVSGIRDPRTNIATYCKKYGWDYKAKNHTAEMMYIVTRPDADNYNANIVEFACYWTAVMPTIIPIGHFNFTKATQQVGAEIAQPFTGIMHIGKNVDKAAVAMLRAGMHKFDFVHQDDYEPANSGV